VDPGSSLAIAFEPNLEREKIWRLDLAAGTSRSIQLEKAVQGVAFAGDGEFALVSHLRRSGTPDWTGDPELAVDRSYGVTWIDLTTDNHRLLVSDVALGSFVMLPARDGRLGATYQAISDVGQPQIVRVAHAPGFDDEWVDLAAAPLELGYLSVSDCVYVTQDHPWGRVTFISADGGELRHVTGFALGSE
jgi:hypothetical protein